MRKLTFALCALCLLLCACDDNGDKSSAVAEQRCPNEKIRVEMDGNLLEFKRDEVWKIYIPNPDKTDTLRKYKDVSRDCDIEFQEGVEIVNDIKIDMVGLLGLGTQKGRRGTYFDDDYKKQLEQYERKITRYDHGVLHALTEEKKGFYVLTETDDLEINGDPIAFSCENPFGCSSSYIHPSGLIVSIARAGSADKSGPYIYDRIQKINQKINSLFINEGEE